MDSILLFFSLCFPMVAGHDLLDHVPTEAYWKDKHVTISGEAMLAQLQVESSHVDATQLIRDLGDPDYATREKATQALIIAGKAVARQVQEATLSEDPEVAMRADRISRLLRQGVSEIQVRRLMAVRTLGELRFAAAEPVLKKLAGEDASKTMLARYAQRALHQLNHPDAKLPAIEVPRPSPEELLSDLSLMPASSQGVLQVALQEPLEMPLEPGLDFKPFFGKGIPVDLREPMYLANLISLVDTLGNVRIDTVSAALAERKEDHQIFITCVVRGQWDLNSLRALLAEQGFQIAVEQGVECASNDSQCKVLLMSDHRLFVVFGEPGDLISIKSIMAGGEAPGLLRQNKRLWPLVETADRSKPIWGAIISAEWFQELPWLKPMDHLTLIADQRGTEFKLTIEAHASQPAKLDAALAEFEKMLDKAEPEAGQIAAMFRCAKPVAEMVESLKTVRHPQGVTASMQTPNAAPLLALPLVLTHNQWLK